MPLLLDLTPVYQARLRAAFAAQPLAPAPVLAEGDLAALPAPVRRFVARSGALGRPRPQNVRIAFQADMFRAPGGAAMPSRSEQVNFLGRPVRLFLMTSRMLGLPVKVLHAYEAEAATMRVRVASLLDVVHLDGEPLSRGETVTLLNDLCLFAPGGLTDPRLAWTPIDDRTAGVAFANGRHRVTATLHFDAAGDLCDFTSEDRPALVEGKLLPYRWSTPIEGWREVDGRRVPVRGRAVYRYPEGDFTYGIFTTEAVAWDLAGPPGA
jgi:hypothetical protein